MLGPAWFIFEKVGSHRVLSFQQAIWEIPLLVSLQNQWDFQLKEFCLRPIQIERSITSQKQANGCHLPQFQLMLQRWMLETQAIWRDSLPYIRMIQNSAMKWIAFQ